MSELQNYTVVDVAIGTAEPPGLSEGVRMYVADEVDARLALMQRAVDWLLQLGVVMEDCELYRAREWDGIPLLVPAEFAAIIKPESCNGTV
jgi:hypothetical protein